LLFSPAVFVLPGIGVLPMAGPVVAALVGALEGAVLGGGFSALGSALLELGVHQDNVIKYEVAIKADQFLLMVHGSDEEIQRAHRQLEGPKKQLGYDQTRPDTAGNVYV
jgi:hypothetical protein